MSDQEQIIFFDRITNGIRKAQKRLFERKVRLGETVVVADADGQPITITAEEALRKLERLQGLAGEGVDH